MSDLEAAWDLVHEALPAGWRVGLPSIADPLQGTWSVAAVNVRTTGRGKLPTAVSGAGDSEAAALFDLNDRLRGVPKPDGMRMDELRRRLRFAYVQGAESWTRENVGRTMSSDELSGVLRRYVGR